MSDSVLVAVIMGGVIIPVIGAIGFLLRSLLKSIEDKIDSNAINVVDLKLSISAIKAGLTAIERDFERQNRQVNDLNQMVINNANKIIEHGHEINTLKAQSKMLVRHLEENPAKK